MDTRFWEKFHLFIQWTPNFIFSSFHLFIQPFGGQSPNFHLFIFSSNGHYFTFSSFHPKVSSFHLFIQPFVFSSFHPSCLNFHLFKISSFHLFIQGAENFIFSSKCNFIHVNSSSLPAGTIIVTSWGRQSRLQLACEHTQNAPKSLKMFQKS